MTIRILATPLAAAALLLCGCGVPVRDDGFAEVFAEVETAPVHSRGDAADDPAIWVNPHDPAESRILGTDKKSGLLVYDLQGRQLQFLDRGRVNNVDLRQGVTLAGRPRDIAVATNRTEDSLDVFEITRDGPEGAPGSVRWLTAQPLSFDEPYGICLHHDHAGALHVFVNDKSGAYQQWRIDAAADESDALALTLLREFALDSKPEGCVADDKNGTLYVGEEAKGVWKLTAAPDAALDLTLIAKVGDALTADVEGLAIYRAGDEPGYLLASSQGDDSFAVFDVAVGHAHRGSFRIVDNAANAVDGAEETDGIAVTSVGLNATFADGLLVVQDGVNTTPKARQNFKLIAWRNVREALGL